MSKKDNFMSFDPMNVPTFPMPNFKAMNEMAAQMVNLKINQASAYFYQMTQTSVTMIQQMYMEHTAMVQKAAEQDQEMLKQIEKMFRKEEVTGEDKKAEAKSAEKTAIKAAAKPATKSTAKPATKSATKTATKPATKKAAAKPAAKPAAKKTATPAKKSVAKPAEKKTEPTAKKPVAKPAAKTAENLKRNNFIKSESDLSL